MNSRICTLGALGSEDRCGDDNQKRGDGEHACLDWQYARERADERREVRRVDESVHDLPERKLRPSHPRRPGNDGPERAIGRPESLTTGLSFTRGGYARVGEATPRSSGGYSVHRPEHPFFDGTGLRYGDVLGADDRIVAYEVDGCELTMADGLPVPTFTDGTPAGFEVLATAPARLLSITADHCEAPAALWGSTIGRSIPPSTSRFPGKSTRARR